MFYDKLKKVCAENNTNVTALSQKLKLSTGNMSKWKNGGVPKAETLMLIAKHFNVSTDYLLDLDNVPNRKNIDIKSEYADSIIACIDILGFSKYTMDNKENPQIIISLFNDIKAYTNEIIEDKEIAENFGQSELSSVKVYQISDTIISFTSEKSENSLLLLIYIVNYITFKILVKYGLLCRGGISDGKFYFQSNLSFGEGYIKAHDLENKIALYPRIIIDPNLLGQYKDLMSEIEKIHLIKKDYLDDFYVADYIGYSIKKAIIKVHMEDESKIPFEDNYNRIKKAVNDELKKNLNDEKVIKKYEYFIKYYNQSIDDILESRGSIPFEITKIEATIDKNEIDLSNELTTFEKRLISAFRELSHDDQMIEFGRVQVLTEKSAKVKKDEIA